MVTLYYYQSSVTIGTIIAVRLIIEPLEMAANLCQENIGDLLLF